ncbi:PTS sugar transporter subunit IIA [Actinosynnema sp. CA-248983]
MTVRVGSPVAGRVVPLTDVPDPVFAQAMVGPGIAVEPDRVAAEVVSPVDGTVVTLHPHAFVVATGDGAAVLVHLGIDTVKRKGEGFTLHVVKGESVRAGQAIVTWDPAEIEAAGFAPICPVIALDASADALLDQASDGPVAAGDALFSWRR